MSVNIQASMATSILGDPVGRSSGYVVVGVNARPAGWSTVSTAVADVRDCKSNREALRCLLS